MTAPRPSRGRRAQRPIAIGAALAVDRLVGDPAHRLHPVVVAGNALARTYAPWRDAGTRLRQLAGGTAALAAVATGAAALAAMLERALAPLPLGPVWIGIALKPTFAVRELLRDTGAVADALAAHDEERARAVLGRLVARDTDGLDAPLLASAAIESLSENLADSVVAPLLAFALAGLPGAAAFRVVNTADAMFGYRDAREWLGKSAARADDALNLLPSRLAAAAIAVGAVACESPRAGARAVGGSLRRRGGVASPNSGWPMAAMAGALDRRLEKPGHYVLAPDARPPTAEDVRRAVRVTAAAATLTVLATALLAAAPLARRDREGSKRG